MAMAQREKRLLVIVGVVMAVLLIAGGAMLLDRGGSGTGTVQAGAVSGGTKPAESPKPPTKKRVSKVPTEFHGVDPFEPFETPNPSPSPSPSPSPVASPSPSPSPTPSATPSAPSSAVVGGHTITLLDVISDNGTPKAVVMVDSTVYTVKTGDGFATDYLVTAIADPCAGFAYADTLFTLCAPSG